MKIRNAVLGKGMPLICVPLMAEDKDSLLIQAEEAMKAGADMAELRFDIYREKDETSLLELLVSLRETVGQLPVVFTIRTMQEGGSGFNCSPALYEELNLLAAQSGLVDLLDIEALRCDQRQLIKEIHMHGQRVIASSHDFLETKPDPVLKERFGRLEQSGADLLKMAVMPRSREDVRRFMDVVREVSGEVSRPVIAMSMGEMGRESRILGEEYGSCVTFGTTGVASAPGQIPVEELRRLLMEVHELKQGRENE